MFPFLVQVRVPGRPDRLVLEVVGQQGNNVVRTVAMSTTDAVSRNMPVDSLGTTITVPVS